MAAAAAVSVVTILNVPSVPTVITAVSSVEPVMVITLPSIATSSTVRVVSVPNDVIAGCAGVVTVAAVPEALPVTLPVNAPLNVVAVISPEDGLYVNEPVSSNKELLSLLNTTGNAVSAVESVTVTCVATPVTVPTILLAVRISQVILAFVPETSSPLIVASFKNIYPSALLS